MGAHRGVRDVRLGVIVGIAKAHDLLRGAELDIGFEKTAARRVGRHQMRAIGGKDTHDGSERPRTYSPGPPSVHSRLRKRAPEPKRAPPQSSLQPSALTSCQREARGA